jgi:NADH-quinone oxidoreductase subunit A
MLWPLAVYFAIVIALVVTLLGLSALLGQRHRERATGLPYESGIVSTGSARLRFGARFYLLAVFFVIFDLEAAFIFAWAHSARSAGAATSRVWCLSACCSPRSRICGASAVLIS